MNVSEKLHNTEWGIYTPSHTDYEYNICVLYVLYGLNVRSDYTKHKYSSPKCALRGYICPTHYYEASPFDILY